MRSPEIIWKTSRDNFDKNTEDKKKICNMLTSMHECAHVIETLICSITDQFITSKENTVIFTFRIIDESQK